MARVASYHFNNHTMHMSSNNEKQYSLRKEVSNLALRFFKYMCTHPFALVTTTLACVARAIDSAPIVGSGVLPGLGPRRWDAPRSTSFPTVSSKYARPYFEIEHEFDNQYLCSWLSMDEAEFMQSDCSQSRIPKQNLITSTSTSSPGPDVLLVQPYPYPHPQFDDLHMCTFLLEEDPEFVRETFKVDCDQFRQSQQNLVASTLTMPEPSLHITTSTTPEPSLHITTSTTPEPSLHITTSTTPEPSLHITTSTTPEPIETFKLWDEICPKRYFQVINTSYGYLETCMRNICIFPPVVLNRYRVIIGDWCKDKDPQEFEGIFNNFRRYLIQIPPKPILIMTSTTTAEPIVHDIPNPIDPIALGSAIATAIGAGLTLIAGAISYGVARATQGAVSAVGSVLPTGLIAGMQAIAQGSARAAGAIVSSVENIAEIAGSQGLSDAVQAVGDEVVSALDEISIYFEASEGETLLNSGILGDERVLRAPSSSERYIDKSWKNVVCVFTVGQDQKCKYLDVLQGNVQSRLFGSWRDIICLSIDNKKWCRYTNNNSTNSTPAHLLQVNKFLKNKDTTCQFVIGDLWCNLDMLRNISTDSARQVIDGIETMDNFSDLRGITIEHSTVERNLNWTINVFHR